MANKYIALRDKRLAGNIAGKPNMKLIETDAGVALSTVYPQIKAFAGGAKVHTMFVLCHGFAGSSAVAGVSMDAGGMGLQLGTENVMHTNVANWEAIKAQVTNVVVYACAAGDTQPGAEGTTADGEYLMGALAIYTGAAVYAADRIQWYVGTTGPGGAFNFGSWEGMLKLFPASGEPSRVVAAPPVELADVLAGTAP